jgi:hypothetical protein
MSFIFGSNLDVRRLVAWIGMMDGMQSDPDFAACAMTKCQRREMSLSQLAGIQAVCPPEQSALGLQLYDLCELLRPARYQHMSRLAFLTFAFPCLRCEQHIKSVSLVEIVFADCRDKKYLFSGVSRYPIT